MKASAASAWQEVDARFFSGRELRSQDHAYNVCKQAHWFYCDHTQAKKLKFGGTPSFVDAVRTNCPSVRSNASMQQLLNPAAFRHLDLSIPRFGCILLSRKRSVLMIVHKGALSFPGGKLNEGESEVECAVRETLEETGLDVSSLLVRSLFLQSTVGLFSRYFVVFDVPTTQKLSPQCAEEVDGYRWVSLSVAESALRLSPSIRWLYSSLRDLYDPLYNLYQYHIESRFFRYSLADMEEIIGKPGQSAEEEEAREAERETSLSRRASALSSSASSASASLSSSAPQSAHSRKNAQKRLRALGEAGKDSSSAAPLSTPTRSSEPEAIESRLQDMKRVGEEEEEEEDIRSSAPIFPPPRAAPSLPSTLPDEEEALSESAALLKIHSLPPPALPEFHIQSFRFDLGPILEALQWVEAR